MSNETGLKAFNDRRDALRFNCIRGTGLFLVELIALAAIALFLDSNSALMGFVVVVGAITILFGMWQGWQLRSLQDEARRMKREKFGLSDK